MSRLARIAALSVLVAFAAVAQTAVSAQRRPVSQTAISRGAVGHLVPVPVGRSVHNIFGTIVSLSRQSFVLRTRGGRLLAIDATTAMRLGTYSAPLFVGKVVVVGGTMDARRVFHANTITRMTRLDATTPADT